MSLLKMVHICMMAGWKTMVTLLLLLPCLLGAPREVQGLQCRDWRGSTVKDGIKYIPSKDDPCTACVCQGGFPVMCTAVHCSPPECSLWEEIEGECCRFKCIEPDHAPTNNSKAGIQPSNINNGDVDKTTLGLRLIASTVTSFLILALLVFMVHRLRQRRMLIMMRRMHADRRDEDTVAYMSQFDQVDVGIEFPPYEEPPPPYTPPKPPDIPHGEAPPPYELTPGSDHVADGRGGEANNNNTTNTTTPGGGGGGGGGGGHQPGHGARPIQGSSSGRLPPLGGRGMSRDHSTGYMEHDVGLRDGEADSDDDEEEEEEEGSEDIVRGGSLSISRSTREIHAHSDTGGGRGEEEGEEVEGAAGGPLNQHHLQHHHLHHPYENLSAVCGLRSRSVVEVGLSLQDMAEEDSFPAANMAASPHTLVHSYHGPGSSGGGSGSSSGCVDSSSSTLPSSRVVVCMHNDNPRSFVVQDVMTASAPGSLGDHHQRSCWASSSSPHTSAYSGGRTQFIKRSESVEIRCGSNSPRNSFYTEETGPHQHHNNCHQTTTTTTAANHHHHHHHHGLPPWGSDEGGGGDGGCGSVGGVVDEVMTSPGELSSSSVVLSPSVSDSSPPQTSCHRNRKRGRTTDTKNMLAPNLTWNKSCRPFRIRFDQTSSSSSPQAVAAGSLPSSSVPLNPSENRMGTQSESMAITSGQDEPCPFRYSSYTGTEGSSPPSSSTPPEIYRRSLPALGLEFPSAAVDTMLGAGNGCGRDLVGDGGTYTSSDLSPMNTEEGGGGRLEVGVSPTGSGQVSASDSSASSPIYGDGARSSSGGRGGSSPKCYEDISPEQASSAPLNTSPLSLSPQSPRQSQSMVRSGSVTSQVSQFSLCSETGEKKRPRPPAPTMTFPRPLRNDVHYPLSPPSSNYAAPMSSTPPVSRPSPTSHNRLSSPPAQGNEDAASATGRTIANISQCGRTLEEEKGLAPARRTKISYVEVSPERQKLPTGGSSGSSSSSSSSSSTVSSPSGSGGSSDTSGGYPKAATATIGSTGSSLSPLSPDEDCQPSRLSTPCTPPPSPPSHSQGEEHPRRGRRHGGRRRKSKSNPVESQPLEAVEKEGVGQEEDKVPVVSLSPDRVRRLSRVIAEGGTTFKQYGFIDDPQVINSAREAAMTVATTSSPPTQAAATAFSSSGRRRNSHKKPREKSQERQASRERREHSQERRREEHLSKEGGGNLSEPTTMHREQSTSRERRQRQRSEERQEQQVREEVVTNNHQYQLPTDNQPDNVAPPQPHVEGRKRELAPSHAASLERRKKRRSTGERPSVENNNNYPVSLTNGHHHIQTSADQSFHHVNGQAYPTTNGHPGNYQHHQNEADLSCSTARARRSKANRTVPSNNLVIVHRNR